MPYITSRKPFSPQNPYRHQRPATNKIIFLSLEGSATEEEYFECVSEIYSEFKTKIQFISVAEDAAHTHSKCRTQDQAKLLSKVRPKQLVERIDQFKTEKNELYQFSNYRDDEFWVVSDVDENWGPLWINEWEEAIRMCSEKGYNYAISNPFFEIWLLLHHDSPTDEDIRYAVTDDHAYEKTDHFRKRLQELGAPLIGKNHKHINFNDYNAQKIEYAINQAKKLHIDKEDCFPKYFASTVYLILNKLLEICISN